MATDDQIAMIHLVEKFRNENPLPGLTALLESPYMKVSIDWPAYLGLSEAEILAELARCRLDWIAGQAAEMARCPGEISQEMAQIARAFRESDCGREWAAEFARRTWQAWRLPTRAKRARPARSRARLVPAHGHVPGGGGWW